MKEYFENLAHLLVAIGHNPPANIKRFYSVLNVSSMFSFAGNNDFLNDMRTQPVTPIMVYINDYTGRLSGTSIDNKWEQKFGHVYIVKKLQQNNFSDIEAWLATCKTIFDDVIAYLNADIKAGNITPTFNILNIDFREVHNQADQFHGLGISFSWLQKFCKSMPVVVPPLQYGTLSAVYADDAEYNDIIRATLPVTNNTQYQQTCVINFKTGKYIVQVQQTIAANSSVVLECTFENIDIFQENIVTAIDLQNNTIGTVIIPATATPVFEMSYTSGTLSFRVGRYVESFITYLALEDGSTLEVNINNYADTRYIAISKVYALATSKRIRILDTFYVDYLYAFAQTNLTIDYNQLEKLRNLTYLLLYNLPNCYVSEHEIEKLTNLTYLVLQLLSNCYIAEHEIEKLTNLSYLYLASLSNCYIAEHEIEKLTKITKTIQIYIQSIRRLKVANNEQFPTHYLVLNNNNMTSTDCDNVFISCHTQLLAGFAPVTKYINVAGTTNAAVTASSLTARTYLLARGYTLTFNS